MAARTVGTVLIVTAALGCVALSMVAWGRQPAIEPSTQGPIAAADRSRVEAGMRLAAVGNCMYCHTAERGRPFAGGRPIATPFGTLYSTNITPDRETGIGRWSPAAFTRAMRRGISRDGHLLYPAFPYTHFTRLSDADLSALYAYLMSRDPVGATPPPNRLRFPFNIRPLLAVWNFLYLRTGPAPDDAAARSAGRASSADVARGRYLVDALAHCSACHSPLNALGAERRDAQMSGGTVDGWDAYALDRLGDAPVPWTVGQLTAYLRDGWASEHGAAAGPMLPVVRSLANAREDDVRAMAAYVLSLQKSSPSRPVADHISAAAGIPAERHTPADARLRNGAIVFEAACASCHGAHAPMTDIGGLPPLTLGSASHAAQPTNILRTILDGIPWQGAQRTFYMPAFAASLTDTQLADVAAYLRAQAEPSAPWPALDDAVAHARKETHPR